MTKPQNPWPSINIGDLRHVITINQQSSTQDSVGQPVLTWSAVRTCYAGFNLISMMEAFGNNQLTSESSDVWTMRWTGTEIKPRMQIVFGSSTYRVQAINNPGKRNILLHVLCLDLNTAS
jgi:head-tail adaptor